MKIEKKYIQVYTSIYFWPVSYTVIYHSIVYTSIYRYIQVYTIVRDSRWMNTEIRSYFAYFAYFAYVKSSHVLLFTDWVDKCQSAICTSVMNSLKSCMSFHWDGIHLFLWVRQELFPLKCELEENQRTFPGHCAIKPRTVVTVVDDGTWTAGLWDGEASNRGEKMKKETMKGL